ncbi:MAG TPA: UvrB/UvrC motif-containing protein [Candidatus Deferrimicrobium sp.]|nr:UvrB/UvrC motif-containing protein [Candidatus Deferrimicrobium sp.]
MVCQDCSKREAQVHITQIVNNEKTTVHLCNECAAARGYSHSPLENVPFPLAEILSSLTMSLSGKKETEAHSQIKCKSCGLPFEAFPRQGRFGCGDCYRTFRHLLEPIMRKIHGASLHRGHSPVFGTTEIAAGAALPIKEEERLELELKKAISSEQYERAAEIRDKLKKMRELQPLTAKGEEP